MPRALNELERDVLDYLVDYVRTRTYQPSIREIGEEFGIKSTKTVSEVLQSLEDKGWIERDASRSRGVRLLSLDLEADVVSVPHIDVHLTEPTFEDPVGSLTLDRRIAATAGSFLVSMVGDSMRNDGIRDGDLVLVEPVQESDLIDGDLVLCRLEDRTSVRRLRREDDGFRLQSGRVDQPVTVVPRGADRIVGRVGAVIRRLRTDRPLGRIEPEPVDQGATAG